MKRTMIILPILTLIMLTTALQLVISQSLSITLDKEIYKPGEVVNVNGTGPADSWIGISVLNPQGKEVDFKMVKSDSTGKYRTTINLPPRLPYGDWTGGEYIVRAYAGSIVATAKFILSLGAKVVGKVVDVLGNPVSGATVTVIELGTSSTTGVDGVFTLYIAQGTYTIKISKEGYRSKEINVNIDRDESDLGTITLEFLTPLQTVTLTITTTETTTYTQTEIMTTTIRATTTETAYITTVSTTTATITDIKTITTSTPLTTTKFVTVTETATATVPTTLRETLTTTLHTTETATATTTLTEQVTQWTTTIALGIVLLVAGIGIGWFVKTLTAQKK